MMEDKQLVNNQSQSNSQMCLNADCRKNIRVLELCIEELKDDNCAFVETVLELENEVKNRVTGMEELLGRTAETARAYMVQLDEYEELTARAFRDKHKLLKHVRNLKEKIALLEEDKNVLQDQNNNLTHDISSFVKLVTHARNTGHWDVGNIEFCDVTFEQVFGSTDRLSHWSEEDKCETPNSLPDHFSIGYNLLKRSLGDRLSSSSAHLNPPSYTVTLAPNNNHPKRDTQTIIQLQGEVNRSRKILAALETDLADRDRTIADLQVQITDLNHEMSRREADCFVHSVQYSDRHQISSIESLSNHLCVDETKSRCGECENRLGLIEQLHSDNQKLSKDCKEHQVYLDKYCSDIEAALVTNTKLEKELSVMEHLWQELEAIKEENETLLEKLEKKCRKEKEMEKKLRAQKKDVSVDGEVEKLREMEERHRVKANGLEMVVQQLQEELRQREYDDNLVAELEVLKKAKIEQESQVEELLVKLESVEKTSKSESKVLELEETVTDLRNELQIMLNVLQTKDDEIGHQRLTIGNLQDALVSLKRNDGLNASVAANDKLTKSSAATNVVQNPQIRRYTSSGDVFDI